MLNNIKLQATFLGISKFIKKGYKPDPLNKIHTNGSKKCMECILCNKLHVDTTEPILNLRLKNDRKHVKKSRRNNGL